MRKTAQAAESGGFLNGALLRENFLLGWENRVHARALLCSYDNGKLGPLWRQWLTRQTTTEGI